MVPRNQFNRMVILALAAILLCGFLVVRAFAEDIPFQDEGETVTASAQEETPSEAPPDDPAEEGTPPEASPDDPAEDGPPPEAPPDDPAEEGTPPEASPDAPAGEEAPPAEPPEDEGDDPIIYLEPVPIELLEDIAAIRTYFEIFLYFVIPFSAAFFLFYIFCKWFYRAFIESAL